MNPAKNFRAHLKLALFSTDEKGKEAKRQFLLREKKKAEAKARKLWRKAGHASFFISVGEENVVICHHCIVSGVRRCIGPSVSVVWCR